ncbi:hypothetical protein E3N88_06014 [Mikania micrantha]|uniref:DUF4378 domain-containing protein n=1 Tax=Mikania micrantha TaxID=192012 RepID=A0A5N6PMM2_9ASTR|nr:hypothetical protein E3N88_06014 [Mikania micrantha]
MPQESLRSFVYRSFVTCEDPRGVVEGKTLKISKTDPIKMRNQTTEKETQSKSSKEAQNETINSWSKGVSLKNHPKDIVKDLLKGALDLQESLMMLGKLQEASCMTNFKKKVEKQSEEHLSRNGSDRFETFQIYDLGYQKERKLANGSSRDCFTELREVIKEGLSKQNLLLPNKSYQESVLSSTCMEGLAGKRKLQLSPDIASTSSGTSSSMVYSTHEFTSSESFSSRATEEKSKGSNLIAKLMGIEEFPSKPPQKQLDISRKMKPVFDVDLPNAKKPQFLVPKSDREHMSLEEIIKMMQSKGLLRSNKQEMKQTSKKIEDDALPIVLMKPQQVGLSPDNQKLKVYENPIRKLHQEKAKMIDKGVRNRGKLKSKSDSPSDKQKASVPVVKKPQRKQEVEKKIGKIQKAAPPIKKKTGDDAKSTNSISKNSSLKPERSAIPNQVSIQTNSSALSTNKLYNQNKNTKSETLITVHEVLQIDSPDQEETKDFEVTTKEINNVRIKSFCEASKKDPCCVREATGMDQSKNRKNQEESGVSDINEQKARILKTVRIFHDPKPANFKLFQGCINEFLEYEYQRQNPMTPRSILPSRICISEDQMTRDILKKIEYIKNYSKFSNESCTADTVSGLLERDLNLGTIGGPWSTTGWKDGCTVNEVEEIVLDLEKLVLSRLIDDVLIELV